MHFELELIPQIASQEGIKVRRYDLVTAACQDGMRFRRVFEQVNLFIVDGDRRMVIHTWIGKERN